VERLGCHACGEERVECEPERGVAHATASVGGRPGKEACGGGREERREEDRGEGAERRRRPGEAGGGGEASSEWARGGEARVAWGTDGMESKVELRGCLEKAREREEGVMSERRRQREDAAVVGMEELRDWIVGGGGGRRGEEAVEGDEKTVRCFGMPRRRGEEAHLTRPRRRREEGGDGNGSKW